MKPVFVIMDEFFANPEGAFKMLVEEASFENVVNPVDGVVYPDICRNINPKVARYVKANIERIIRSKIKINTMFARLTCETTPGAPHKVHSDKIMGQYSAHIYISKKWPDGSGTSFWTHPTEGGKHTDVTNIDRILKDQNDKTKWTYVSGCQAMHNRVLIHDATFWHCAEPEGGFGKGKLDGRIVLTTFFDLVE